MIDPVLLTVYNPPQHFGLPDSNGLGDGLDPVRLRAEGLVAIFAADRADLDEYLWLTDVLADTGGPHAVEVPPLGGGLPLVKPVPTIELAVLALGSSAGCNLFFLSARGYNTYEPEDGGYHIVYGRAADLRPVWQQLKARYDPEVDAYLSAPHRTARGRAYLETVRRAYTIPPLGL